MTIIRYFEHATPRCNVILLVREHEKVPGRVNLLDGTAVSTDWVYVEDVDMRDPSILKALASKKVDLSKAFVDLVTIGHHVRHLPGPIGRLVSRSASAFDSSVCGFRGIVNAL